MTPRAQQGGGEVPIYLFHVNEGHNTVTRGLQSIPELARASRVIEYRRSDGTDTRVVMIAHRSAKLRNFARHVAIMFPRVRVVHMNAGRRAREVRAASFPGTGATHPMLYTSLGAFRGGFAPGRTTDYYTVPAENAGNVAVYYWTERGAV